MAPIIVAATPERWPDVVTVVGDCADGRRCWCAYWYLPNRDFKAGWGDANRATLEREVLAGAEPGLLAYVDGEAAAWALVGPRDRFDRLNRSKALAPVDDRPAWAVACFIVRRKFRRQGLTRDLIAAAVDFARRHGASVIEAYPVDAAGKLASWDLFLGPIAAFRALGFAEVARRLPRRPILRLEL